MRDARWLPVVGFEGLYEVSDHGGVRRAKSGRLLRGSPNKRGYCTVILYRDRKQHSKSVHLMVLEAHVGPRPDGLMGCHGPGGQQDNHVANLRWDTQSNNVRDQLKYGTHPSGATEYACGRGHVRTAENTYWKRGCRDCDSTTRSARKAG